MAGRRQGPAVGRRGIDGQSMVELIIAVPVLMFMILAVVQFVLLYRVKTTLDYATLMAARAGAVTGVNRGEMSKAYLKGMLPLLTRRESMQELQAAYMRGWTQIIPHTRIEVISPTRAAWNEFKERQFNGRDALPNDTLAYRSDAVGASGVNVQDANLLKIRIVYDAPLIVPFMGLVLGGKSEYLKMSALEKADLVRNPILTRLTGRFPVESSAIVRMQSPIYERGNLDR